MKNLILTLIITLPLTLWGQGWEQNYGGNGLEEGFDVHQTSDGGFIVSGKSTSFGGGSYLLKTNSIGSEEWYKIFQQTYTNSAHSNVLVEQTNDGGYIVLTDTSTGTAQKLHLIKTSSLGNISWRKTLLPNVWLSDMPKEIKQTNDGGYIIINDVGAGIDCKTRLIKTQSDGTISWTNDSLSVNLQNECLRLSSVEQTNDGGYIICGNITYPSKMFLIKVNYQGIQQWYKTWGYSGFVTNGTDVNVTNDGGFIISGGTNDTPGNGTDVFLIKTDSLGNEQWNKQYGGTDSGLSTQQTNDGGFIVCGNTYSNPYGEIYVVKTNSQGDSTWTRKFGCNLNGVSAGGYYGHSIQQTNDGGYIICGSISPFFGCSPTENLLLIKIDGNGNLTSLSNIPTSSKKKLRKVVDLLGREIAPKPNTPIIEIYDDGSVEKKLIID